MRRRVRRALHRAAQHNGCPVRALAVPARTHPRRFDAIRPAVIESKAYPTTGAKKRSASLARLGQGACCGLLGFQKKLLDKDGTREVV
jgi:hypothetical protein